MSRIQRHFFACFVALATTWACSFSPNVPNGHLICQSPSECPSGYTCESVPGAEVGFKVCCKDKGCGAKVSTNLPADGSNDLMTPRDGQTFASETGSMVDGPADARRPDSAEDTFQASPPDSVPSDSLMPDSAIPDSATPDSTSPGDTIVPRDILPGLDLPAVDVFIKYDSADGPLATDTPLDLPVLPDLPPPDLKTPDAQGTCGSDQDCPTTSPMCLKGLCTRCATANDCTGNVLGSMCNTTSGRCTACLVDSDCKDTSKPLCGQGQCTSCTYATTPNGCCDDTHCTTGGSGTIGKCTIATHTCSYACDSDHKACGTACIPSAGCCVDGDCTGGGVGTSGTCGASNICSYPCDSNHKDCNGTCVPTGGCCSNEDCSPGYQCNASNACEPLPGCTGTPLLGCACSSPGDTACNTVARPNKVPLVCQGGLWTLNVANCAPTENCDWNDGACKPIVAACAGKNPGDAFCDYSAGITAYKDVRKVCGADLVDVTTTDNPCAGTCGGAPAACQPAKCSDGKIESGEECDDGNTVAIDGCEPSSCVKSKVLKLALGDGHGCALCKGGYVRCWGDNSAGQLGLGLKSFEGDKHPYAIHDAAQGPNLVNLGGVAATDITAGYGFTCALLTGGSVRCWGVNDTGQLGLGNTTDMAGQVGSAISFGSGLTASSVSAGWGYACAVLSNGTIRCWGDNSLGLLGLGNTNTVFSGTVALGSGVVATGVAAGGSHACALISGGGIHCWGDNYLGEFGIGSQTPMDTTGTLPSSYGNASLKSSRTATSISVGSSVSCSRLDDGELECWGYNNVGQLGLGNIQTIGDNEVPGSTGVVPTGTTAVAQVANGAAHTCIVYANNAGVKCWGANENGELGYGDTNKRGNTGSTIPASLSPIQLPSGPTATAVYAGTANTCVLLSDASVRCWGWNDRGQLGLGVVSGTQLGTPAYIGGASNETPNLLAALKIFGP